MKIPSIKDMVSKSVQFTTDVTIVIKNHIVEFVKGCWNHAETISILTLSSIGLTSLLSELPFAYTMPMWIESPMVIPVISVLLIILLVKLAEHRSLKRASADLDASLDKLHMAVAGV